MRLLFKNRVFAFSNLAALINYSATYAVTFLLSLDLQFTKGFSPEHAGLILIVQPAAMAVVSPIAGRLSDRIDPQIVASAGMGLTALGLFLLSFLVESTPLGYMLLCLVVFGVGLGLFSSPNTNAIMSAVEKRYYGVASGMNGTMRLVGQMLSMGIAMMLFSLIIGRVEITPDYYPQFIEQPPLRVRPLHDILYFRDCRVAHAGKTAAGGRVSSGWAGVRMWVPGRRSGVSI